VEVDIVGEWARLEGKGHTMGDHFLVEVLGAKWVENMCERASKLSIE